MADTGLVFSRRELLTWPNLFTLARFWRFPFSSGCCSAARTGRRRPGCSASSVRPTGSTAGWPRLDQMTEFGAIFDPVVDRLMFFVAVPCC